MRKAADAERLSGLGNANLVPIILDVTSQDSVDRWAGGGSVCVLYDLLLVGLFWEVGVEEGAEGRGSTTTRGRVRSSRLALNTRIPHDHLKT